MLITVWIVSGLLALAYLVAGGTKLLTHRDKLLERMGWVGDFPASGVKLIGALEILGAIGLVLPVLTGIAPILTPIAAIGLALIQILAIPVHARRHEAKSVPGNIVLLALAIFVAIARFASV
jgi:uncharacterized membrane protein